MCSPAPLHCPLTDSVDLRLFLNKYPLKITSPWIRSGTASSQVSSLRHFQEDSHDHQVQRGVARAGCACSECGRSHYSRAGKAFQVRGTECTTVQRHESKCRVIQPQGHVERKGLIDEAGKIAQPQRKVLEGSGAAWPPPFRHGSEVGGFSCRKLPLRPQGLGGRGTPPSGRRWSDGKVQGWARVGALRQGGARFKLVLIELGRGGAVGGRGAGGGVALRICPGFLTQVKDDETRGSSWCGK